MKYLNRQMSLVGLFAVATSLLVFYLLSIRWQIYLPEALFWVAVASMLGTVTYQILGVELNSSGVKLVLLEIVITCVVFHLIYVIPFYGLAGYDPYFDMAAAKCILSSGFIRGDPRYIDYTLYSNFPMIHVLGAELSMITAAEMFSVAKWVSPLIGVAIIPPFYLIMQRVFGDKKVALLSALLFASLQDQMYMSSQFIRETLGLVLGVCCLYLYISANNSQHPAARYALSIMCLIGTVLAHHLTSFMLLLFLSVHFVVTKVSNVQFFQRVYFGRKIIGEKETAAFLALAFSTLLAYWMFVESFPLRTTATVIADLFSPWRYGIGSYAGLAGISALTIRTVRGYFLYYGFYFFLIIFGLILLYRLLFRSKNRRLETYSFTLYLFLCGLIGFVGLYIISTWAWPDRFLTYGWLFGFSPLVVAILEGRYKWLRRIGVLLLIAFMLFNIFMIDPAYLNAKNAQETWGAPTLENYVLANAFDFSTGRILADQNMIAAIVDVHGNLGTIVTYSENISLTYFDWIIIQKREMALVKSYYPESPPPTIAVLEHLVSESSPGYAKVYESDNLVVFTVDRGG